jgi:predicted O-linked N-acetylglucosamine transferase (SPINDLY family)
MRRAEVMLDTIGFSGFNTAMQAVECSLSIVTREGRFLRGRLAGGVLQALGLTERLAPDEQHYVDLAVALASDRSRRAVASQCNEQRRHTLYNDVQTMLAVYECLLESIRS